LSSKIFQPRTNESLLAGLTGGVAAGKSTVLRILESLGQKTLDADRVVHELYRSDANIKDALRDRYGARVVTENQGVDRGELADIVFDGVSELTWLNELVHPAVKRKILEEKAQTRGILFCAVPLLFEVGWERDVNFTVAVWTDSRTQQQRLADRKWDSRELARRQSIQLSMDEKLERADYGIINTGSIELLQKQITRLIHQINTLARQTL